MKALLLAGLLAAPAAAADGSGNLVVDQSMMIQLDPLIIRAPRVRAQKDLIDPRINQHLLRLLKQNMEERPGAAAQLDASLTNLARLSTESGFALKTRYTELGFLLTEGLAGTDDFQLQSELENAARLAKNGQTRAAALVSLAYTKNLRYLPLFQGALLDPNITVRFAALESLLILGDSSVQFQVANAARSDNSFAMQIYGAAGLWRMGDITGREILIKHYQNPDWFVRAMAIHYLGELGGPDEYLRLQRELTTEQDPSVQAELASALLKLHAKERK